MYLGVGDEDPPVSHPVRHGVIVGAVSADEGLREVALVPFLFVVPSRRLVWETRYIVRAGISPQPVDPWLELDAMRHAWSEFNVRVLCVPSSENPLLRGGLIDRDLVIGLDEASVRVAAELCPGARPPALVNLGAELPWRDAYGSPLLPLTPFLVRTPSTSRLEAQEAQSPRLRCASARSLRGCWPYRPRRGARRAHRVRTAPCGPYGAVRGVVARGGPRWRLSRWPG